MWPRPLRLENYCLSDLMQRLFDMQSGRENGGGDPRDSVFETCSAHATLEGGATRKRYISRGGGFLRRQLRNRDDCLDLTRSDLCDESKTLRSTTGRAYLGIICRSSNKGLCRWT